MTLRPSGLVVSALLFVAPWVTAAPPAAPTNLMLDIPVFGELNATWEDNADDEEFYSFEVRTPPDGNWIVIATYDADVTEAVLTGGSPVTSFEFRVVANIGSEGSESNIVSITTPDFFTTAPFAHILLGQPFSFTVEANNSSDSKTIVYSASSLPPGLSIDPASGEISGTPTEDGYFDVILEATYSNPEGPPARSRFALRIPPNRQPPALTLALPSDPFIALEPATSIDLNAHFADPDTRTAVRIDTTHGSMVFSLFDRATPDPVENFLGYVDDDGYADAVFHRSVNDDTFDIIQSGSFTGSGAGLTSMETGSSIKNAPGIPNDRGTLAYARTSNPNSATRGWYINAQDSPGLDVGDSYTVFGRATDLSLGPIDTIFAFPTGTYDILRNGPFPSPFAGFPTTDGNAPTSELPGNLIVVNQIARVPALTYTIDSNSNAAVVSAAIVDGETGPQFEITPLAAGESVIGISVADIDQNRITETLRVTVLQTFGSWIAGFPGVGDLDGPDDDPDRNGIVNLVELALLGDPTDPATPVLPALGEFNGGKGGASYPTLQFPYDPSVIGLEYAVEASTDLGDWQTVWSSADGTKHANVVDFTPGTGAAGTLTVHSGTPKPDAAAQYLRLRFNLAE